MRIKNKRNFIIVCVFILISWLLLYLFYFPKAREVKKLDSEYISIISDIEELDNFIGGPENLEDNIVKIRRHSDMLEKAFPFEKDLPNVISFLNEEARAFGINVLSLRPKNTYRYTDREGKELKVLDYLCKGLPLRLKIESGYIALGKFLMSLEVDKSPLITIEEVDIVKGKGMPSELEADIDMTVYMRGK